MNLAAFHYLGTQIVLFGTSKAKIFEKLFVF